MAAGGGTDKLYTDRIDSNACWDLQTPLHTKGTDATKLLHVILFKRILEQFWACPCHLPLTIIRLIPNENEGHTNSLPHCTVCLHLTSEQLNRLLSLTRQHEL